MIHDKAAPAEPREPMAARLIIEQQAETPREVLLNQPVLTIGRSPDNAIKLEDSSVSRRHGRLERQGQTWHYTDMGSANGSFLNGQRLENPHVLQDGDILHLSDPATATIRLIYRDTSDMPRAAVTGTLGRGEIDMPATVLEVPEEAGPPPQPYLRIQVPGQSPNEVALDRPIFTLGRGPDNDIVIPQPASRNHSRLVQHGTTWHYTDLGSTNGTYIGEQRIQSAELRDGDILLIGDPQGNWVRMTFLASRDAEHGALIVRATPKTIRLDQDMVSTQVSMSIGRNPQSDIPLVAPNISWAHARLDTTAQGQILVDLGSTNGTFVNGNRITGSHILQKDDVIQIGPFRLVFDGLAIQQYDQRGGMRIDVQHLTLQLKNGRKILDDVSLSIAPREFVALVGGSGAGKSTLMKAISGFRPATDGSSSPVLVNGDDYYQNLDAYRAVLGYVPQDDILHQNLPVAAALHYSANLRLPADTTPTEIQGRIGHSLDDVEMGNHLTTVVKSLSGGQRKRVSIAAEMLADPSLFFLDEPTSGLDPGLEKKMMYTLRRLADGGRTIVLVTHATDNITQCDHVVFLEQGQLVYFGPPSEALAFFGVESGSFSDIYTRLKAEPDDPLYDQLVQTVLKTEYAEWQQANPQPAGPPPLRHFWQARYAKSEQCRRYVHERQQKSPDATKASADPPKRQSQPPRMSFVRQLAILTRRYADLTLRDRRNLTTVLLQSPIIAIFLLMLTSFQALIGSTQENAIQRIEAQSLLFTLAIVGIWFGIVNAASELTKERDIYRRERLANLSIAPYLLSKVLVLSVIIFLQNISLLLILWLFGFGLRFPGATGLLVPAWIEIFLTMMLASLSGIAIGLVISAATRNVDQATSLVPLVLIPQILFSGILYKLEGGIPAWLSNLMISRWALDALGTSANVRSLCQLPNVLYGGEIITQCELNLRQSTGANSGMLQMASPLLQKTLDDPADLPFPGAFAYEPGHLLLTWGILLAFIVVGLILTAVLLKRQDQQV